jgi:hypothetical protein
MNVTDENRNEVMDQLARSYAAMDGFGKQVVTHNLGIAYGVTGATIQECLAQLDDWELGTLYDDIEDNGDLVE